MRRPLVALVCTLVLLLLSVSNAMAHGVTLGDQGYISEISGVKLIPFIYLGAKHMVTGYDHLLFLLGVIFFLYGSRQIAAYVSLFAIGHSTTMLIGVYFGIGINGYIIDAIIGFSVVYKALDNLGAFRIWFGHQPNTKVATLIFGLLHGFGLASKILEYDIAADGLVPNLLAFNLGVEIGQIIALMMILLFMSHWRSRPSFVRQAYLANVVMMTIGFVLMGLQITGYVTA
ncbi:HupE/UreJ family protein [Phaeobacter sp.]|uniref:HupE/UreJ family protein n=1 Tax=Phaeobacter sp. TaxID=1902409 RepID=UPI0025F25B6D|nr:HupE/UreJ family protein [Phaeobacter sp.]